MARVWSVGLYQEAQLASRHPHAVNLIRGHGVEEVVVERLEEQVVEILRLIAVHYAGTGEVAGLIQLPVGEVADHYTVEGLGLERRPLARLDLQTDVVGNPVVRLVADDARRSRDITEAAVVGNLAEHPAHGRAIALAQARGKRVEAQRGLAGNALADIALQAGHVAVAHHLRPLDVVVDHVQPGVFLQEEMLLLIAHAVSHRAVVDRLRPSVGESHAERHCHKPILHFPKILSNVLTAVPNQYRCRARSPSCFSPLPPPPTSPPWRGA